MGLFHGLVCIRQDSSSDRPGALHKRMDAELAYRSKKMFTKLRTWDLLDRRNRSFSCHTVELCCSFCYTYLPGTYLTMLMRASPNHSVGNNHMMKCRLMADNTYICRLSFLLSVRMIHYLIINPTSSSECHNIQKGAVFVGHLSRLSTVWVSQVCSLYIILIFASQDRN